jgi:hypothetical protein
LTEIPIGCKVGFPEQSFLFGEMTNTANQVPPVAGSSKTPPIPTRKVPDDDSAWKVYEKLPVWARVAAKTMRDSGGRVPKKRFTERGYSNKQLKQMVHGPFAVAEESGSMLALTKLGEKVVTVSLALG